MMSLRVVNAGDGYAYLLRSVATNDEETSTKTRLGDYYAARGTPPGRWYGRGLASLDSDVVVEGAIVEEAHMGALYGEGLHPEADEKMARGASIKDVQLGRAYPFYTGTNDVLKAIQVAEKDFRAEHDRRPTQRERNDLALQVAIPAYQAETGFTPSSNREVLAWLNEKKNSVRQATAGFDLTFSPVKSISLLWALGDEDTRLTIERIHSQCVNSALEWIEDNALFTRCEADGIKQLTRTSGMIAAQFVHYDTRLGDPDLHTHCLVSNKVLGPDGKWRSIEGRSLMRNAVTASNRYNAMMMQRLGEKLGIGFVERPTASGKQPIWEISGIDSEIITAYSKRREGARPRFEQLCHDYRTTHGREPNQRATRKLWQQAVLDTRPEKEQAKSLAELRKQWAEDFARTFGDKALARMKNVASHRGDGRTVAPAEDDEQWAEFIQTKADQITALVTSRRATFRLNHLRSAGEQLLAQARFSSLEHRQKALDEVTALTRASCVCLTPPTTMTLPKRLLGLDGKPFDQSEEGEVLTTKDVLRAEQMVLDSANEPTGFIAAESTIAEAIKDFANNHGFDLNTKQQALVRHFATSGMQTCVGVGPAGTGKTAAMKVYADICQRQGHTVIALAPSAQAALGLGESIGADAQTIAALTYRWRGQIGQPKDLDCLTAVLGEPLKPGDVLLVDEAGMSSTEDLACLTEIANATGAVIRMIGDPHQLDAIETGGMFRLLAKRTGTVELDQVIRQGDDTDQAEAGLKLREGDVKGLELYDKRGWITGGTHSDVLDSAIKAYLSDVEKKRSTLLLASTNHAVAEANARIQAALQERGVVAQDSSPSICVVDARAFVGDHILARHNANLPQPGGHTSRVVNGQVFVIDSIDDSGVIARNTENGRKIRLGADYMAEHTQLGYAATIYRAQGATVDTCHAVVDSSTDRRGLYVAMTRGKKENRAYVVTDFQVDEGEEDAHLHMDGDQIRRSPHEICEQILQHSSAKLSAAEVAEALEKDNNSDQTVHKYYRYAFSALHHDYAREMATTILGSLPDKVADSFSDEDKTSLRNTIRYAARRGALLRRNLESLCRSDGSEENWPSLLNYRIRALTDPKAFPTALPPLTEHTDRELYRFVRDTKDAALTRRIEADDDVITQPDSVTVTNDSDAGVADMASIAERYRQQIKKNLAHAPASAPATTVSAKGDDPLDPAAAIAERYRQKIKASLAASRQAAALETDTPDEAASLRERLKASGRRAFRDYDPSQASEPTRWSPTSGPTDPFYDSTYSSESEHEL